MSNNTDKPNPDGNTGGRPEKDVSDMTNPSSISTKANGLNERGE